MSSILYQREKEVVSVEDLSGLEKNDMFLLLGSFFS